MINNHGDNKHWKKCSVRKYTKRLTAVISGNISIFSTKRIYTFITERNWTVAETAWMFIKHCFLKSWVWLYAYVLSTETRQKTVHAVSRPDHYISPRQSSLFFLIYGLNNVKWVWEPYVQGQSLCQPKLRRGAEPSPTDGDLLSPRSKLPPC